MPVTHTGGAPVWGNAAWTVNVGNSTSPTQIVGAILNSSDSSSDAKEMMHTSGTTGGTIGVTFYDTGKTITVECYIMRNTVANAILDKNLLPKKGTRVVITAAAPDASDDIAGTYVCMASSKRRNNSDKLVASLTLQQWDELTSYDSIAG